jgi:hypothetical protein
MKLLLRVKLGCPLILKINNKKKRKKWRIKGSSDLENQNFEEIKKLYSFCLYTIQILMEQEELTVADAELFRDALIVLSFLSIFKERN